MNPRTMNSTRNDHPPDTRADAERDVKRYQEHVIHSCLQAVLHLERFTAEARREIEAAQRGDAASLTELPGQVLAASAWGAANAATELQRATKLLAAYSAAVSRLDCLTEGR